MQIGLQNLAPAMNLKPLGRAATSCKVYKTRFLQVGLQALAPGTNLKQPWPSSQELQGLRDQVPRPGPRNELGLSSYKRQSLQDQFSERSVYKTWPWKELKATGLSSY